MATNAKSIAAFVMAMDLKDFGSLSPIVHLRVVDHLYPRIAKLVGVDKADILLDRKTIGDGFMFYFESVVEALHAAMQIRMLFLEDLFWTEHDFKRRLQCRIGLHAGQFFRKRDAIEQRDALFGHNVITVARLEPIVGANEIWCTQSFMSEALLHKQEIDQDIAFHNLGIQQFAKTWLAQVVYGVHRKGEAPPKPASTAPRIIHHNNKDGKFKKTFFALVRLRDRAHGVENLKLYLSKNLACRIEAVYYIFGAFDVLVRFKAGKKFPTEEDFGKCLKKGQHIRREEHCSLTEVTFEGKSQKERIVKLLELRKHIKAFTWIKSHSIVKNSERVQKVVELARKSCGREMGVVTYYKNSDVLILPIVVPVDKYYALSDAIEDIEKWVDRSDVNYDSIITYPVHGLEEDFKDQANQ
jgi:hypothetical protein